jgi:hypothetical protein
METKPKFFYFSIRFLSGEAGNRYLYHYRYRAIESAYLFLSFKSGLWIRIVFNQDPAF